MKRNVNLKAGNTSLVILVILAIIALIGGCSSFTNSPTGVVKVPMFMGSVSGEPLPEGASFMAPWKGTEEYSTLPHTKVADGKFLTSDKVELSARVQFLFSLNRSYAAKVRTHIGDETKFVTLIENLCQSALREAAAQMPWIAVAVEKRQEFEHKLQEEVVRLLIENLQTYGFSETDAVQAVKFSNPVVNAALPPERLAIAISEQQAAKEELSKQETLTKIATEVATRRKAEGHGIAEMIKELPKDFPPEDIAKIIQANAQYKTAEALAKAVELGKLNSIVFTGAAPATPTVTK